MTCLFCQSEKIKKTGFPRPTYFNNKIFQYFKCCNCKLIFINPLPGTDDYNKMYSTNYHDKFYFKHKDEDYSSIGKLIEQDGTNKTLVDYGCGDGSLLNFFSKKGYHCIGIEYDPNFVERLKGTFKEIEFCPVSEFEDPTYQSKADIIHVGDVLEHLTSPVEFMQRLHSRLNQGGMILIKGPLENNFSLALVFRKLISAFKKNKKANHIPYHITFSNSKNQKNLFEKNGFISIYYKVYETAWPFPEKFSLQREIFFQWIAAKISIFFSKISFNKAGNRFIYVGRVGRSEKK